MRIFLTEISLPLALEDFLLVIFFAIGLYFVAKTVSRECAVCGKLALFGGLLITLGGFFKVCWKLILATTQNDIAWLNNGLFVWLSCGFICLAWALWRSRKKNNRTVSWLAPLILIGLTVGVAAYFAFVKETRAWFFILLGITTLFNLFVSFQLIFRSVQNKLWLAVGLFVFNMICFLSLGAMGDQTVALQWAKQIIGTFSQASFAFGAYLLKSSADNYYQ
jgi:hypothetical protein